MSHTAIFKKCPGCAHVWEHRDDFLNDSSLRLNGYKADRKQLEYGLYFFTHHVEGCCSTMAFEVHDFLDLYSGVRYHEDKSMADECPRLCEDEKQLSRCDALCECAFAREIMHLVRHRQGGGCTAG